MSRTRHDWVDVAKGLAILLVVIGHAWRGINARGLIEPDLFTAVDGRIYAFHMPVFFALSGLFLGGTLARASAEDFIKVRFIRLIWPMVLWTYLFLGTKLLAGKAANQAVGLQDLLILPIPGQLHFWFLWALFLQQLLLFLTRPAVRSDGTYPTIALASLFLGAVVLALIPFSGTVLYWAGQAMQHLIYLVLGIILGHVLRDAPQWIMGRTQAIAASVVFVALLVLWSSIPDSGPVWLAGKLTLTLTFLIILAQVGAGVRSTSLVWLRALGVASMVIYLSHTIFSAAFREALLVAGLGNVWLQLLVGTVVGIVGPLILQRLARQTGLTRVLGF